MRTHEKHNTTPSISAYLSMFQSFDIASASAFLAGDLDAARFALGEGDAFFVGDGVELPAAWPFDCKLEE